MGKAHLGLHPRRLVVGGRDVPEAVEDARLAPRGLVEAPVQLDPLAGPEEMDLQGGRRAGPDQQRRERGQERVFLHVFQRFADTAHSKATQGRAQGTGDGMRNRGRESRRGIGPREGRARALGSLCAATNGRIVRALSAPACSRRGPAAKT
jgi:hypothetical protein